MKNKRKKILISGGHLTPALSLIDFVQKNHPNIEIVFVGREFSQSNSKQKSHEKEELSKRKIKFISFNAPQLSRPSIIEKVTAPFKLAISTIKALFILVKNRPHIFVSFGGYLAIPLAFAAWILSIAIITHEQTMTAGHANQVIAKLAKRIAVSFTQTKKIFPKEKTVFTGNPIRHQLLIKEKTKPTWAKTFSKSKPILFVTGGNQGSYIINLTLSQAIPKLTNTWNIVHACGNPTTKFNYKKDSDKIKRKLTSSQKNSYVCKPWLSTNELAWIYQNATGVISRAGANTVQEIAIFQIPSILIPLPFAKGNEQLLNAKSLTEKGGAILLSQKNFNAESLLKATTQLKRSYSTMKNNLKPLQPTSDGAKKLWKVIEDLL